MANFQNNAITENGILLKSHVDMGAVFTATKIVLGAGYIPAGKTAKTMTAVVDPVKELTINKKERSPDGKVIFGGVYTNEDVTTDFYFRELALYAKAVYPDGTEVAEVLYSYGNAEGNAERMAAYSTSTVVERQMDIVTFIGNEAGVDLTIESGVYVTMGQLETILAELGSKPHAATHAIGGADPIMLEDIGAAKDHKLLTDINLLEWAMEQTVGGTFFTNNNVAGVPFAGFWHGFLSMGNAGGDKGIFIFNGTEAYSIATGGASFANSKWVKIAVGEFLPLVGGTLHGSLGVSNGLGLLFSWQNQGDVSMETGTGMDAYFGDTIARMEVVNKEGRVEGFLSFIDGDVWVNHQILHTGNAPAVTATAELV